jgi:hypothetical protein
MDVGWRALACIIGTCLTITLVVLRSSGIERMRSQIRVLQTVRDIAASDGAVEAGESPPELFLYSLAESNRQPVRKK